MSTQTFKTNIPGTSISSGIQWTCTSPATWKGLDVNKIDTGKSPLFLSAKLLKGHFLPQIQVTQTHQLSSYRHYWNDIEVGTLLVNSHAALFW